jgi:hypothetical protein
MTAFTRNIFEFCRERPVVLAGLGLALGAALAAGSPATEAEDQFMGERSDALKGQARRLAQEQYENATRTSHDVPEGRRGQDS